MAERLETMSRVKVGGFRSQLGALSVSSHTVCVWMVKYIYICMCLCVCACIYIYVCVCVYSLIGIYLSIYIHHHVMLLAEICLALSRHPSLSFIAFGRSSGLHPVSSHSCCMYVRAGRPAFAWPYEGVHRSTSLMSSSLLPQQCPLCLARLTCIYIYIYIWG